MANLVKALFWREISFWEKELAQEMIVNLKYPLSYISWLKYVSLS